MKGSLLILLIFFLFEIFVSNHVVRWGDEVIFEHKAYIKAFQIYDDKKDNN